MSPGLSEGFAFDIGDVWRRSTFQLDDQDVTLFRTFETNLPALELQQGDGLFKEDFELPQLEEINVIGERQLDESESISASSLDSASQATNSTADVWSLDCTVNGVQPIPRLRTWDAFEKTPLPHAKQRELLSEAGQSVFDAAAKRIEGRPVDAGVLPQDTLLRSLFNLALGRSSINFRWDEAEKSFVRTLAETPMSGYSAASSDSIIQHMIKLGTRFRMLRDYGQFFPSGQRMCTALIALKESVIRILDGIEQHFTRSLPDIRSLPQLCKAVERPSQLLAILDVLKCAISGLSGDEDVISAIADRANELVASQTQFANVIQTLLARISAPWLERLCVDLHLSEDNLHQRFFESETHAGEAAETGNCSFGDFDLDEGQLPGFVGKGDRALILECKRSLAALRRQLPEHNFAFLETNEIRLLLSKHDAPAITMSDWKPMAAPDRQPSIVWSDNETQCGYLEALDSRISQPLAHTDTSYDGLQVDVDNALAEHSSDSNQVLDLDISDFNPVEKLRPVIQRHARLINETVLRHIFWSCKLRDHLELHRQYHLFENGDFVARLSTALFSEETQSAQRRRGNVPTGETMGLRLGARDDQHWPPASSELRLTLAGILTETYQQTSSVATTVVDPKELPGGLSFSIRELPDDEIERVLDSGSLYALDFLRLQYNAPLGLDAVITASCMQAYDAIFKQLLRMLRMLNVVTKLREGIRLRKGEKDGRTTDITRFCHQAHHFVSGLLSYVLDIGIQSPWQVFIAAISRIEAGLGHENERHGHEIMTRLDELRRLHEQCLDTIRARLFLRQKHQKVRNAIEDAFNAILRCNASLENNEAVSLATSIAKFHAKVTSLISVMHGAVTRSGKAKADMRTADSDAETMSLLLKELNWNGFYVNEA